MLLMIAAIEVERTVMDSLRRLRKDRGLTQVQCSRKTGVSQGFISKIESGACGVSPRTLQKLAWGLNVDPVTLIDPEGAKDAA